MTETVGSQMYSFGDRISLIDRGGNAIEGDFKFINMVGDDFIIGVGTHTVDSSTLKGVFEIEGDQLRVTYRD